MASSQNKLELNVAGLPELAKGLQRLRNDKKFCDFVIECSGVQFAVHRVVLCSRSEYFERMCSGEFKEAGKGTVKLVDEDPDRVSRMLDFMYGLVCQPLILPYKATAPQATTSQINSALKEYLPQPTYPSPSPALNSSRKQPAGTFPRQPTGPFFAPPPAALDPYRVQQSSAYSFITQTAISDSASTSPTSAHQNHALIHAQMYGMGEKYWNPDLKNYAKLSFSESIRHISVASLCEVITEVYASTPETDRGLRDIVLDTAVMDLKEMIRNKELKKIAIEMVPQFGYELLERMFGGTNIPDGSGHKVGHYVLT